MIKYYVHPFHYRDYGKGYGDCLYVKQVNKDFFSVKEDGSEIKNDFPLSYVYQEITQEQAYEILHKFGPKKEQKEIETIKLDNYTPPEYESDDGEEIKYFGLGPKGESFSSAAFVKQVGKEFFIVNFNGTKESVKENSYLNHDSGLNYIKQGHWKEITKEKAESFLQLEQNIAKMQSAMLGQMQSPKIMQKITMGQMFTDLSVAIKNCQSEDFKKQIISEVMEGTEHNNLLEFHKDFDTSKIDGMHKMAKYSAALQKLKDFQQGKSTKTKEEQLFDSMESLNDETKQKAIQDLISSIQEEHKEKIQELEESITQKNETLKKHDQANENLGKIVQELEKQLKEKKRETLTIVEANKTIELKEYYHKQLPEIVQSLKCRNHQGHSEFHFIYGGAGVGKGFLIKQIAKCLGNLEGKLFSCGPTTTEGRLLGRNNQLSDKFVQGWIYPFFKNGGICAIDEACFLDSQVIGSLHALEGDEFTFGDGERVARHKDFYLILLDNTKGTGSKNGFTRNMFDAATLDRFIMIELFYDEQLEQKVFGNAEWAQYVQRVRRFIKGDGKETGHGMGSTVHITSRAIRQGAAQLAQGIAPHIVCERTLFKLMNKDMKETIIKNVGVFNPSKVVTFGKTTGGTGQSFHVDPQPQEVFGYIPEFKNTK